MNELQKDIFSISNENDFNKVCLDVFHFQYQNNIVYRNFVNLLNINLSEIIHYSQIPFLPIEFFKTQTIISVPECPKDFFASSGTTGAQTSKHWIHDFGIYEESFHKGFSHFYGDIRQYNIFALLPNYLEQPHSSLIYMISGLIKETQNTLSGFYLADFSKLSDALRQGTLSGKKNILFGVTYALLDFIEQKSSSFPELIVFETGGMKGRRKEMIRNELHQILCKGFGVNSIHSEYGMSELFSQAYSQGNGLFTCPPWMKILIRDTNDPLSLIASNKTGGINVIDLANLYSCSFIATQDLGKLHEHEQFEILGRFDHSDIRGCNLMIE